METRKALIAAYKKCLNATYTHLENDADYATEFDEETGTLYLLFQWTHSTLDWWSNLDFFPRTIKPYKNMDVKWKCHRGFHRVWKTIEPEVEARIADPDVKRIVSIGYSHGAAIAAFAHEYCWYHRPDIRSAIIGFGFGAPRIFFGHMNKSLKERWMKFFPIRSNNDIVTHVPPRLFGFRHVNKVTTFKNGGDLIREEGEEKWPRCVVSHTYKNYIQNIMNGKARGPLARLEVYKGECENYVGK